MRVEETKFWRKEGGGESQEVMEDERENYL